jgi:hypothetical protein
MVLVAVKILGNVLAREPVIVLIVMAISPQA